jgi:hypothetical protein
MIIQVDLENLFKYFLIIIKILLVVKLKVIYYKNQELLHYKKMKEIIIVFML